MILINKPRGLTPLQALEKLRQIQPELKETKLAYAGRLDPQAQGLLLVLQDEECLERDQYQDLDKVYEFELLLGVGSDTGDIMGMPELGNLGKEISSIDLNEVLPKFVGEILQNYPAYSSKTVNGDKLFKLAQRGEFPEVSHTISINKLELLSEYELKTSELLEVIHKNIKHVTGKFRQKEIIAKWEELLGDLQVNSWHIYKLVAEVGSGTYIRQLCTDIGQRLGTKGLALKINRTIIGKFALQDSIDLE